MKPTEVWDLMPPELDNQYRLDMVPAKVVMWRVWLLNIERYLYNVVDNMCVTRHFSHVIQDRAVN